MSLGFRMVGQQAILRAARTLLAAEPWLMSAVLPDAAAMLGWTVTRHKPDRPALGAFLDADTGLGPKSAFISLDAESRVQEISLNITEELSGSSPEADAFKQDTFAAAAAALTGVYGRPSEQRPGEKPQLWWRRDTTTLRLVTQYDSIALQLSPNKLLAGEDRP
ncbi:DUF6301 family protein [Actinoplanes oblitus]|uniref:DUF6301 family protein n=1 Tax=Actinoplanes oblitus TaxID=3040509 RepID=A0ABY8WS59_9ACTN|nr:DUF6301 family protein [Actinoplanes oblitus]WIM99933.1 DUF6301 family protein [Actinoplanes oblitus]